ncbi:MAG: hypothetical protein JWP86_1990 [Phenylobacterium sp.]|nr:hypothetical protein [Phenylobacterium sp.]
MTAAITGESPGDNLGLLLGILVCIAVGVGLLAYRLGGGPPKRVYGMVVGFGLSESQVGSLPMVRVEVDERQATVRISRAMLCNLGDRIELDRRKAPLGYRYNTTLRGCFPANSR